MTNKDAKVFSRFALFVVAVLLFSSFSAFVSNKAQAEGGGNYPAPADGDWIITNETYVYNETIVLNGNLTIENGGKLTLRGVVLKMNVTKDGQYRIEVKSGGELHILDWDNNPWTKGDRTIITDGDNDDDSAPYNDQEDTNARYYIVVRNGAVFELKNSEVSEAGYLWGEVSGIYLDGRADYIIENNTIKNCYRGLNLFYSYNKVISGNIFKECDAQGIIMYSSTGNLLENNVFENTPQGLYLYRDAWDNIIRNNTFRWNTQGIYLRHVNTYNNTFINNTVEYNSYGVFVVTDAHHNILINSTITGNSYYDVYLDEGTNLTLLNTDYDSYYVSGGAYLTEMEYINIEVEDLRGDGIKGVDVKAISREINVKSEEDNLASPRHGTKATANSQYNWRFLAGRVQDGKGEDGTNQEYYWLTKDHPPAGTYLMLDFTKPHRFNKVRLLNTRNAGNYDRSTKDFHLAVSKDGVNFQSIYNGTLTENDITNWYEAEFEPVEARYLRFYVDSYYGVGAGLAEIEVYNTGKVKKPFDFEMYATSGFGGKQKKTNAKGEVVAIPVIEKRFYSNNVPQYFATDIQVSYHGWNDKKIGLNVTSETTLNFVKDVLTVGPSEKDFSSIQEAVDHAQEEKKIVVFPGRYKENVVVEGKELNIFSSSENGEKAVIDAEGGKAFLLKGEKEIKINGFFIENASTGVEVEDSLSSVHNLSFINTTTPFSLKSGVTLHVVDCEFNSSQVYFEDSEAKLYEMNNLVVFVHNKNGSGVGDVMVKLRNATGSVVKKETTRDDGTTKQMTLTHRLLTKNGETLFSPYTVLILKGEGTNKEEVMMDSKKNLSILWYDPTRFGESVSIGDLDGDGVEDYAVGAPNYDGNGNNSGAVFLYKGRENLVLEDLTTENYDAIIYGERAHDHFGTSVSLNGDLNGDGFADLIVGAPYTNFSEPRGINAHYYHWVEETKFGVLVFETKEDNIDHDWEQGKPYDKVNKDQFAVRWDGFINIERSGHYTFYLEIDDGGRLYIDEELLIESWKDQQATEYPSDPVYLEKGLHNFVVEYYENGGAASIKFKWSSEYFEKEVVPPEAFRYTKERGAGKGGVYIIPGGRSFEELKKSNNALELSSTVLTMERYVEEFGKGVNYLGDLNGDGFDELGVLAEREGSEGETLYIYHGSPIITTYDFKPLIASLLEDEDGSKNFTLLFPENEWMNMVSGNRGTFNVSSEGYLNINTSHSVNAYAYVVSKNPFLSGIDFTIKFKKRSSQELYPILSIMNYPVPEEDVADSEKQREATLLQIYDKGMIEIFTSPGSIGKEIELQNPGSYPELRIVVTPEHENITIYQSGKRIAGFDISNWSEGLYLLIGDSYTGSHQGKGTILKISSSLYWEMFNTNYSFLSFWDGELIDNDKSEFVISSYNTMIFKNSGMRVFPVLENETILYSNGDFNKIKYENGTLSLDFGMNDILPNGNFDNGWDNWTRTTNVRDKNNGHWEITTEEHGDWKVYKGPTAGLGPDRDYVGQNNRGRPCDGRLVSEPFVVPAGTKYIDLWHHAKWWSFEVVENLYQSDYDDMIIIRVRESDTGEVVDEVVYKRPSPDGPKNGEEEGRLQLDVSDYGGHKLQLEAEVVTNYNQYDDGLVQIDDIKALTLFKNGSFTSANISLEESVKVLLPQWNEVTNGGRVVLKIRTDSEKEWNEIERVENGEMLIFENGISQFQYRFEIERGENKPSPEISNLQFLYFNESSQPLNINTTGSFKAKLVPLSGDGFDELLIYSEDKKEVMVFNGTQIKDGLLTHKTYLNMESYWMRFKPEGGEESERFGAEASLLNDIDGDGLRDVAISDPEGRGRVYIFYSSQEKKDYSLSEVEFIFKGKEEGGGLGTVLLRNLASYPYSSEAEVEVLPTYLTDVSIASFNLENNSLIYPNTTLNLSFLVANIGYLNVTDVDYEINIVSEDGEYSENFEGNLPEISVDHSAYINVSWNVPDEESVKYNITITIKKSSDMNKDNNRMEVVVISRYYKTRLTSSAPMDSKRPGEWLIYNLTLKNTGTLGLDVVNLSAQVPENWEYKFLLGGEKISNITVEEGSTAQIQFLTRSPLGAELREVGYNLSLNATSRNGVSSSQLSLKAYLVEVDLVPLKINLYRRDGVEIGSNRHLIQGETSKLEIEILNRGNLSSTQFSVSLYQNDELVKKFNVSSVESGERVVLSTSLILYIGDYHFKAVVDEENTCFEYTETNNEITRSTTVIDSTPDNSYHIYGRVFNLEQEAVEGAEFRVSVEGYGEVFTAETDENGQAEIELKTEEYYEGSKLKIEAVKGSKYGDTIDYAYSEDGETHIMLVLMKYSLSVEVDNLSKVMYLNESKTAYLPVDYIITITNSGVDNESYELSAWKPFGWDFKFIGNVTKKEGGKYSLTLKPKSSEVLVFRVINKDVMDSPSEKRHHANEIVNITFFVKSESAPFEVQRTTHTIIHPEDNLTIHVINTEKIGNRFFKYLVPGTTDVYTVNLINYGNTHKTFYAFTLGKNSSYIELDRTFFSINSLDENDYRAEFNVNLTVPDWLKEGEEFWVDILIADENSTFSDYVRLGAFALKRRDVEVEVLNTTYLGGNGTLLKLEVINPTKNELFVSFEEVSFVNPLYQGIFSFSSSNLTLGAEERKTVNLTVFQDNMGDTEIGKEIELSLFINLDNVTEKILTLTYLPPEYHHLLLKLEDGSNTHIFHQGEVYFYNLTLKNMGNGIQDIVSFKIDDPDGWATGLTPTVLKKGEEVRIKFKVTAPVDGKNGEYNNITITAVSQDGTEHSPLTLVNRIDEFSRLVSMSYYDHSFERGFINYTVRVRNEGEFEERFRIEALLPQGSVYSIVPDYLLIPKGRSKYLYLVVESPSDNLTFLNYTIRLYPEGGIEAAAEIELPGLPVSRIEFTSKGKEYAFHAASSCPVGASILYFWEISGPNPISLSQEQRTSSNLSVIFDKSGDYTLTLRTSYINQTLGEFSDTTSILIHIENTKPDLSMIPDNFSVVVNETLVIDASEIRDLDGTIMDVMFIYNEKTTHGTKFIVRFDEPGEYFITLRALDNLGEASEKTLKVNVTTPLQPESAENQHLFSNTVTYALWGVALILFLLAALFIPKKREMAKEGAELTSKLLEMRELKKKREEEIKEEEKRKELERTHQKCSKCGSMVPKKMNFCIKCGNKLKEDIKTCPKCSSEVPVNVIFCVKCGFKFPETLIDKEKTSKFVKKACPNCGNVLEEDAFFCDMCGTRIKAEKGEKLEELKKCPTCGKFVGKHIRFCIFCGEKLEIEEKMAKKEGKSKEVVEVEE